MLFNCHFKCNCPIPKNLLIKTDLYVNKTTILLTTNMQMHIYTYGHMYTYIYISGRKANFIYSFYLLCLSCSYKPTNLGSKQEINI